MKLWLSFSCALLLASLPSLLRAQNASASDNGPSSGASQATNAALQDQMKQVVDELRALREENQQLKDRLSRLEQAAPQAAPPTPQAAAPETKPPAPPENPLKMFTPYGEIGFRYQGLFNEPVASTVPGTNHLTNLYNRGEGLVRFGLKGEVGSRLSYNIRLSTGVSNLAGDPWISLASPGDRRYVGLDTYNITWSAPVDKVSSNLTNLVIVGKVNNIPAATGLTEMLVDKDFGLEMGANLALYKFDSSTTGSLLTSVGFVTNQGAVGMPAGRFLGPVVSGGNTGCPGGLVCGDTSDIYQYGSPRANAYVVETALDHTVTEATKLRGSFTFVDVSHPSDVPLFIGLTGLLGIQGLSMPNMPQGIQTNIPLCLPRNPDGVVPITGTGGTALMTGEADCGYASAYRLIDFFGSVRLLGDSKYPIRLLGEFVKNLGAGAYASKISTLPVDLSTQFPTVDFMTPQEVAHLAKKRGDGLVLGIDIGDPLVARRNSFTYKFLLIGSDIMLDYPTNDQWHTNIRGHEIGWQYRFNKNVTWETTLVVSKNYDPLLPGFSSLANYPLADLTAGQNPWMTRPRTGIHVTF